MLWQLIVLISLLLTSHSYVFASRLDEKVCTPNHRAGKHKFREGSMRLAFVSLANHQCT